MVITSIKSGMQYSSCQVLPEEHENLCKTWALRTYKSTRAQIAFQETEEWIHDHRHRDPDCVHSMENFAWNHSFVNIHKCMMIDILHQLSKRVVGGTHILQWLKTIIGAKFKGARIKADITKSLQQANGTVLLDQHFRAVPSYPTLKIFKESSELQQWDGSEYWAACYQLVSVVTLLLIKDNPAIL